MRSILARTGFRFRLLPALILICIVTVGLRSADLISRIVSGTAFETVSSARAEESKHEDAKHEGAKDGLPSVTAKPATHEVTESAKSDAEFDLLQTLGKRREELDKRDEGIAEREATLKVAETRLDQKMTELTTLKGSIEKLLDLQKTKQNEQVERLVKIYSGMKPQDAARIFNTLEMPVLLAVVSKMKEQKTSAIIASMPVDRARELTTKLADLRSLPDGAAPAAPATGAPTALTPAAATAAASALNAAPPRPVAEKPAPVAEIAAEKTEAALAPPPATPHAEEAEAPHSPIAATTVAAAPHAEPPHAEPVAAAPTPKPVTAPKQDVAAKPIVAKPPMKLSPASLPAPTAPKAPQAPVVPQVKEKQAALQPAAPLSDTALPQSKLEAEPAHDTVLAPQAVQQSAEIAAEPNGAAVKHKKSGVLDRFFADLF